VLPIAPMLIVDSYKARRAWREHERMTALRSIVVEKSKHTKKRTVIILVLLAVFAFTNSPREIEMASELRNIRLLPYGRPATSSVGRRPWRLCALICHFKAQRQTRSTALDAARAHLFQTIFASTPRE